MFSTSIRNPKDYIVSDKSILNNFARVVDDNSLMCGMCRADATNTTELTLHQCRFGHVLCSLCLE